MYTILTHKPSWKKGDFLVRSWKQKRAPGTAIGLSRAAQDLKHEFQLAQRVNVAAQQRHGRPYFSMPSMY